MTWFLGHFHKLATVKIVVTSPLENTEEVRNTMCEAGAGFIGQYSFCSMSTNCVGTFKGNESTNPYIGEKGKLEYVDENKIEVQCDIEKVKKL